MTGDPLSNGSPYAEIDRRFREAGLMLRGGLAGSDNLPALDSGRPVKALVLVGHAGSSFWPHFCNFLKASPGPDPLDRWTRSVVEPVADVFECQALYPFDRPWWPFQRWIMEIEGLRPSPLGILIHPEYGLWHGYRAALVFREETALPDPVSLTHACENCADKPCLGTCPVEAVTGSGFDLKSCRDHLPTPTGEGGCMEAGCLARNACPVGSQYRYDGDQLRFHMAALDV